MRWNQKGKGKIKSKSIRRMSAGLEPAVVLRNKKQKLFKVMTKRFYQSHVVVVSGAGSVEKLGHAKRNIEKSTCIILKDPDVSRFVAMVTARRRAKPDPVEEGGIASKIYESPQRFEMMVWKRSGAGVRINGTFSYSMLRDIHTGVWYVHHLQGTEETRNELLSGGEFSESDDFPESDDEDSFDFESDEEFEALRSFGDS